MKPTPWPPPLHSQFPFSCAFFFFSDQLLPFNIVCNFVIACLSWLECQLPEGSSLSVLFIHVYQEPRIVPGTNQAFNTYSLNKWMINEWILQLQEGSMLNSWRLKREHKTKQEVRLGTQQSRPIEVTFIISFVCLYIHSPDIFEFFLSIFWCDTWPHLDAVSFPLASFLLLSLSLSTSSSYTVC